MAKLFTTIKINFMFRQYLRTLLIHQFWLPSSFIFQLLGSIVCLQPAHAQSALFFTRAKVADLKKLQTTTAFTSGDTVYGAAYVHPQNSNGRLEDYAVQRDGNTVFPVTVTSEMGDVIHFDAALSAGINKPKKTGFMAALSSSISNPDQAFYFQVLPTSKEGLTKDWIKFFANLYRSPKPLKIIHVTVGTGEWFHTLQGHFTLDFSGGSDPYSNWTADYVQQENKRSETLKEENALKLKTDSIEKIKARFDSTEAWFPPSSFKSKIVDAKLEKEIATQYKSWGWTVHKICLLDAENSSTFLVLMVVSQDNICLIVDGWLERQNPYGNLVKFTAPARRAYNDFPLRCEKVPDYLK